MSGATAVLVSVPFGLAIGLALGMVGGGGAVLAVPVLVYVLGEDVHAATTASLAIVAAGASAGALAQTRRQNVCWRHAAAFSAVAVTGAAAGTIANQKVAEDALLGAFGAVMIVAALATSGHAGRAGRADASRCPHVSAWRLVAVSVAAGSLTGFFGVGGGFLIVPALVLALGFPFRSAAGTSLVIVSTIALLGLGMHLAAGAEIRAGLTVAFAVACSVGSAAGGLVAPRVPQRTLAQGFALLLSAVGIYVVATSVT
jgi:uncharacterized protein